MNSAHRSMNGHKEQTEKSKTSDIKEKQNEEESLKQGVKKLKKPVVGSCFNMAVATYRPILPLQDKLLLAVTTNSGNTVSNKTNV